MECVACLKKDGSFPHRTHAMRLAAKALIERDGPRPEGMLVRHLCENDSSRPNGFICSLHTVWGTAKENIADQGVEVRALALEKARAAQTREMKLPSLAKGRASANHPNKLKVTCPHCGKEGAKLVMSRYHFDKCKHKTIS